MFATVLDCVINQLDHYPISVSCGKIISNSRPSNCTDSNMPYKQSKLRWDYGDKLLYYELTRQGCEKILGATGDKLDQNVQTPTVRNLEQLLDCFESDSDLIALSDAQCLVDTLYDMIVCMLQQATQQTIPSIQVDAIKYWWDQELDILKEEALKADKMWKELNCPKTGATFEKFKTAKYKYKTAIRRKRDADSNNFSDTLYESLLKKNNVNFWRIWNKKVKRKQIFPSSVDGVHNLNLIAEGFGDYFSSVCTPEIKTDQPKNDLLRALSGSSVNLLDLHNQISVEKVDKIASKMKKGKAQDIDGLSIEHIEYSHPILKFLLTKLFNFCLQAGVIPTRFGLGLTVPIPKTGSYKSNMKYNEFRGISINSVLSKIFEHVILENYGTFLQTSDYQMGFKKGLGCNHVTYSVKQISDYFSVGGSVVNICTLDINKAFDKVNYYTLLTKLLQNQVPINVLCIVAALFWSNCLVVKWINTFSSSYRLIAGVRQGGVLSPILFANYVDGMLLEFVRSKLGCCVHGVMCSYFMYADDIVLVTASLTELQKLVKICISELKIAGLSINANKCAFIRIGRTKQSRMSLVKIDINGVLLAPSQELRCLGVHFAAGTMLKFKFDHCKGKFYNAANAILAHVGNRADLVLPLCNAQCVPILLYAVESMSLTKTEKCRLAHPYFRIFAKLFHTFDNTIINQCYCYMDCLPLEYVIDLRMMKFLVKLASSSNELLKSIYQLKSRDELINIQSKYGINNNSKVSWRTAIWRHFEIAIDFSAN